MSKNALSKYKSSRIRRLLQIPEDELAPFFAFHLNEIGMDDLTEMQQEKLVRYAKIWSLRCLGRTKQMVLSTLMKDHNIEERQARYDLSFTEAIYGKLENVEIDARRAASIQFNDLLSQLALKEKDFAVAMLAREKADKLAGLHKEEKEGLDPAMFEKPSKIVFNVQVNNNYGDGNELDIEKIALDE